MRNLRILIVATLALVASVAAYADHYSDTYVIPVAGHTAGINGSLWTSDLAITNFAATPLTVQIIVVESGLDNFDNIYPLTTATNDGSTVLDPNSTVLLRDVLNGQRGRQNIAGALILGGDKPFAVTSRISNGGNGGDSVGETVPPARDFFENSTGLSDNSAVVYLPGLVSNATARANVGFVAGSSSDAPMTVSVTIKNSAGETLGTRTIGLPASNFTHTQFSVSSITNTPFDIGSAEFRITSGTGTVVPYASVIDNASNNAAYIMGQFPDSTPFGATSSFSTNIFRKLIETMTRRPWTDR